MKYESLYSIGQVVWMVRNERFSRIVKCSACKNTGEITVGEEKFICPKCSGRSAHEQYGGQKFYVYDSSEVGKVSIEDEPDRYRKDEPNPRFTYMVNATGIGSGQVWEQECLFATEEDAQRFCDIQNKVLLPDETEMLAAPVDRWGKVVQ